MDNLSEFVMLLAIAVGVLSANIGLYYVGKVLEKILYELEKQGKSRCKLPTVDSQIEARFRNTLELVGMAVDFNEDDKY